MWNKECMCELDVYIWIYKNNKSYKNIFFTFNYGIPYQKTYFINENNERLDN